ncbi:MAG TPA: ABC transporter ATP-binding protein [Acholeplasma sp.]|nr:ABC transporter ATP-binding protein [Acholeplasma sp.]
MMKQSELMFLRKNGYIPTFKIIVLSIINVLMSISIMSFALLSKYTVNSAVARDRQNFTKFMILLACFIVLELILMGLNFYLKYKFRNEITQKIKRDLYDKIINLEMRSLNSFSLGDLSQRLKSDVDIVGHSIIDFIPRTVFLISRFVSAFALLFIVLPLFAVSFILFGFVVIVIAYFIGKLSKRRHLEVQKSEAISQNFVIESLNHIDIVKAFDTESYYSNRFNELTQTDLLHKNKRNFLQLLTFLGMQSFFALGYLFSIVFGAYQLLTNNTDFTFGDLTLLIQLVQNIQSPLSGFNTVISEYHQMISSTSRIMSLYELPHESHERIKPLTFDTLHFEHVTFKYLDKENVFEDFNLEINQSSNVLVKGLSGSGKTTLLKLMLGLEKPKNGKIYLHRAGYNIDISSKTRSFFSYVPQSNFFHSGSIYNLLTFGKPISKELVYEACKTACILDDILKLPLGFETNLSQDNNLSLGQLQRLAIARALLKNSPIMLFDELSSQLDLNTEKELIYNLCGLKDKTLIFISHRPLDESLFDKVIEF